MKEKAIHLKLSALPRGVVRDLPLRPFTAWCEKCGLIPESQVGYSRRADEDYCLRCCAWVNYDRFRALRRVGQRKGAKRGH